jgi:hypothetical protein
MVSVVQQKGYTYQAVKPYTEYLGGPHTGLPAGSNVTTFWGSWVGSTIDTMPADRLLPNAVAQNATIPAAFNDTDLGSAWSNYIAIRFYRANPSATTPALPTPANAPLTYCVNPITVPPVVPSLVQLGPVAPSPVCRIPANAPAGTKVALTAILAENHQSTGYVCMFSSPTMPTGPQLQATYGGGTHFTLPCSVNSCVNPGNPQNIATYGDTNFTLPNPNGTWHTQSYDLPTCSAGNYSYNVGKCIVSN